MDVIKEKRTDMLFLDLRGRLDDSNAQTLEESLMRLIDDGARQLIVDCSQVEYINNAGIRTLLNVGRRIVTFNGRIAFHSLSQAAKDIFDKTGFAMATRIYETREEAIAGVAASGFLSSTRTERGTRNK